MYYYLPCYTIIPASGGADAERTDERWSGRFCRRRGFETSLRTLLRGSGQIGARVRRPDAAVTCGEKKLTLALRLSLFAVLFVAAVTRPPRCGAAEVKVTPGALCIPMCEQPSLLVSHLFAFDGEGQNKSSHPDRDAPTFTLSFSRVKMRRFSSRMKFPSRVCGQTRLIPETWAWTGQLDLLFVLVLMWELDLAPTPGPVTS